jgi:hypothetical protein
MSPIPSTDNDPIPYTGRSDHLKLDRLSELWFHFKVSRTQLISGYSEGLNGKFICRA